MFLDTDVTRSMDRLARELAATPYDEDELERILLEEVYPVCIWNLYATAGNWTGFDEEELIRRIEDTRARPGLWRRLWRPVHIWSMARMVPEWREIAHRIAVIRGGIPK
ncbi:hypothetical protein [uncultured Tateyamaria sp.]|uniref:DUF7079 family protein n=1 Tax=uncultured Tateyamaria sp. TaxID=455651 RepID=UPI00262CA923|nr:hypothetical protein [uncultured Tateyamaria sp.]